MLTIDRTSGGILTWSATLVAKVEDEFGNPVSNVPVSFAMGTAVPHPDTCAKANADFRPGQLVAITDSCLDNNIPAYGDCGAGQLAATTSDQGAAAQVILGGVPDADYPITVTAGALAAKTVVVASQPFGNCDGNAWGQVLKSHILCVNNHCYGTTTST